MKNIVKISPFLFLAACFCMLFTGCEKEEDVVTATINSVSPGEEYPRGTINLEGSNFEHVQYVYVGTRAVDYTLEGKTITFQIPEGTVEGEKEVTLVLPGGSRTKAKVTVLPSADPIFESFSKKAARAGEEVTITGGSLDVAELVTIGGVEAEIKSGTATALTFIVPEGVEDKRGEVRVVTNKGEKTAEFTFYVGKETVVTDFDGNQMGEWGGIGGAVDAEASGVKSASPDPIDGQFFKMVGSTGGWGGSQIVVEGGFGLSAARDNVMLVVDMNTNGTSPNYRFNVSTAGDAKFWSSYQGSTTGWQTLEIPLKDFGWSYSGDGESQMEDGQAIVPSALEIIKVQWGSPVIEGGEVNFDNVRFIEF